MNLKDAYWFSHDSNAKDDPKTMLLIDQLGLEGYGIFWVLIETLRDQPGYKYPLILLPALAKRYITSSEKMHAVVKNYSLFVIEGDEFFFSESLKRRMQHLEQKREQARVAGKRSGEVRRIMTEQSNGRSTDVERRLKGSRTSKGKESKVKKNISITPEKFYELEIDANKEATLIALYEQAVDYILAQTVLPKMEGQLSYKEFATCYNKAKQFGYKVSDYLKKMENWKDGGKDVSKKNKTITQTIQNWMNNDAKRSGKI